MSNPFGNEYEQEIKEAWTDVIVEAWTNDNYLEELRSDPKKEIQARGIIDKSKGKYLPIPKERPPELQGLSEEELRQRLNEDRARYFEPMMMGGAWDAQNDGEAWTEVLIRAWKDKKFLEDLRSNPKAAIEALRGEKGYEEISNRIMGSEGKYFPITKEPPPELQGLSEEELRRELNKEETTDGFGWIMMCCL